MENNKLPMSETSSPLLSIIVPVYNVELYLRKCVDSLLNQDLKPEDYEIILIDDGSPDRCGEICEIYAAQHSNIKVIHRENGGLSAARNSGIDVAQGRYVQFVDSDDYLEPNVLKTLVDKIEHGNLDILRFNYQNVNEQYEVFDPNKNGKLYVDYSDSVCDGLTFLTDRLGFACYAWQFMIRKELLDGCCFKEGIYFEDVEWTPRLLLKADRVTSTELIVYNYLLRQGSITKSVDDKKKQKVLEDLMQSIDSLQQLLIYVEDKRWFQGMISLVVLSIYSYVVNHFYERRTEIVELLKLKKVFPLSNYHASKSNSFKIRLTNIAPNIMMILFRFRNT